MRRKQMVGTKYDGDIDAKLDRNQNQLVDALITPHVRLPERGGAIHKIVASYPAHHDPQMPIRGSGPIVWNRAYEFQAHGPSFLDPTSPGMGGGY